MDGILLIGKQDCQDFEGFDRHGSLALINLPLYVQYFDYLADLFTGCKCLVALIVWGV